MNITFMYDLCIRKQKTIIRIIIIRGLRCNILFGKIRDCEVYEFFFLTKKYFKIVWLSWEKEVKREVKAELTIVHT